MASFVVVVVVVSVVFVAFVCVSSSVDFVRGSASGGGKVEAGTPCNRAGETMFGEIPSNVYPNNDICAGSSAPFCNFSPNSPVIQPYQYTCQECLSDCDCAIGSYCQAVNSNPKYGTCMSYSHMLGKPCIDTSFVSSNGDYYSLNQSFCGVLQFYYVGSNLFINPDWSGPCIKGSCRACDSRENVGSLSQYSQITFASNTQKQVSCTSNVKPARFCKGNRIVYYSSASSLSSHFFTSVYILALLFTPYILIF